MIIHKINLKQNDFKNQFNFFNYKKNYIKKKKNILINNFLIKDF
jgi:hypothetical protein